MPLTSARNMRTGSAWNAPRIPKSPTEGTRLRGMVTSQDHTALAAEWLPPGSASSP